MATLTPGATGATPTPTPTATPSALPTPAATQSATPAPTPSAQPPTAPNDGDSLQDSNAEELIGGTWDCTTFAGTSLSHQFSRSDDGAAILAETSVKLEHDRLVTLHEKYVYHSLSHSWTASLANGAIVATAAEWVGDTWTFNGHSTNGAKATPFRMTYTRLGDGAFRRDFRGVEHGVWTTYSGETCLR